MKYTQIPLDDTTCEAVRRRAFDESRSMASVVRETLAGTFGTEAPETRKTIEDFTFAGIGSDPNPPEDVPVSVDHDRWYAQAVHRRRDGAVR